MKRNKIILYIIIPFFSFASYGQKMPHYTQYLYNMQVLNPAYAGVRADLSMSLLYRSQWVGVPGAPETKTFSISGRVKDGLGFGATVIDDKLGLAKSTNINVDGSYTIITSQHGRLAFGLKGGLTLFSNNLSEGITPDNDKYSSTNGRSANVGFGTYYYNKRFFVGFSIPYLLKTSQFRIEKPNDDEIVSPTGINYFLTAGMVLNVTENIKFKPSTILKHTSKLPISIDLNANVLFKELIETGISYRYNDSVSALFAVIINENFRIGYTYDRTLTNFGERLSSHEVILHLDLNFMNKSRWLYHDKCYF